MLDHTGFLEAIKELKALRASKDEQEERLKVTNYVINATVHDIVEYMEATDQLSVKVKGLGTAILTNKKFYGIDKDDPNSAQAFEQFVKDRGEWDLVTAVHASKLHGYYKEKLELNEEVPPGVKTAIKTNITIRGN